MFHFSISFVRFLAHTTTHREVPLRRQFLGEMIERIGLGAHGVPVAMDLVEQVCGFIQPVVADVNVLFLYPFRTT